MPDGTLTLTAIERRTFTNQNGEERAVWNMKDAEDRRFSTFDAAIARAIEEHKGQPLAAQWSEKQKGEYLNRTIVALPGLVEKQQGGGGRGPAVDEDRADRRAALMAASEAFGPVSYPGMSADILRVADYYLAWLRGEQTSAGVASRAVPASHEGTPAEPSPRNPWNQWIEETFPNLSITEHRRLVKAALATKGLEKLPEFGSDAGADLRMGMKP